MCTVLYIPKESSACFASLRDENPLRPKAKKPAILNADEQTVLAPFDPLGKGTWIGVNNMKNVVVLLNGAYTNHERQKSYAKSRGLIVKELLDSKSPIIDWSMINFEEIEPFTLVVFSDEHLFELVWDGKEKHRQLLDKEKPRIWSSSTLYDNLQKEARKEKFDNWIAMDPPIHKLSVLDFFKAFRDIENGFLINRNESMKTISYSFLEVNDETARFDYYDLIDFKYYSEHISIKPQSCSLIENGL